MRSANPRSAVFLACAFLALNSAAFTQTASSSSSSPAPPSQPQPTKPKPPQADADPPASEDNSFPEDVSRKAAAEKKQADQAPDAPAAGKAPTPADDNAFPEDISKKAAEAAKDAGSSGVSSSSDYDRRVNGGRNAVPADVPLPHRNGANPLKEDIDVGSYYLSTGNYTAAYQRFKEAVKLAPVDTDAMFGLAEAARHLKKRDEALANYRLFLQIVDSGTKARDARKAVAALAKDK